MKLPQPFIRLPFSFDAQRLASEANALPASAWMPHPNRVAGNSAVALISSGGGDNDSFEGAKAPTRHLAQSPYTRQCMASFTEVLSRARFMRLDPGAQVSLHVDFNYHWFSRVRIHIPVQTDSRVRFVCGSEEVHMAAGESWIFDSWRRHNVINNGPEPRIHLVIDTVGSSRFWTMVDQARTQQPDVIAVPYEEAAEPPLLLEQHARQPVMSPGECEYLVEDLIADFSNNPDNNPQLVEHYRQHLRGFVQDWRHLWSLYGESPEGIHDYRALIEQTRKALHPERRALTTASNDIGVNPIFVQRVLNAVLG